MFKEDGHEIHFAGFCTYFEPGAFLASVQDDDVIIVNWREPDETGVESEFSHTWFILRMNSDGTECNMVLGSARFRKVKEKK